MSRSKWVMLAVLAANNLWWRFRLSRGIHASSSFGAHYALPPEESVAYIEEVFNDYKRYGGVRHFDGTVAEVGPGDSIGVALLMRADGCRSVDLIDRFSSAHDVKQQSEINRLLSQRHNLEGLLPALDADDPGSIGITWRTGEPAEQYFRECAAVGHHYNFIVSRAVMEHLYDPLSALVDMVHCMAEGGKMLHKIDLRDHGLLSLHHHDLTWLTVPTGIWKRVTSHSGHPNRILLRDYIGLLDRLRGEFPITYRVNVSHLVEVGSIEPHRPFEDLSVQQRERAVDFVERHRAELVEEFRNVDAGILAITGCFLVVERQ